MKFIGYFRHGTELTLAHGDCTHVITPISCTVTIEAKSLEEAIEILDNYSLDSSEVYGYDSEFTQIIEDWNCYSLQAITQSLI